MRNFRRRFRDSSTSEKAEFFLLWAALLCGVVLLVEAAFRTPLSANGLWLTGALVILAVLWRSR